MKRPTFSIKDGSILHQLFEGVVFVKLIHGLLEVIVGVIILFLNHHFVSFFLLRLSEGELLIDRMDVLSSYLHHKAMTISNGTELFIGAYLLIYGIVKVILALGLLFDRRWSYGFAIITLSVFIAYEIYRVAHTHSLFLFTIIVLDIITLALIWAEQNRKKRMRIGISN